MSIFLIYFLSAVAVVGAVPLLASQDITGEELVFTITGIAVLTIGVVALVHLTA